MCGRYTIYQTDKLASRFDVNKHEQEELLKRLKKRYNAAPGQYLPVVTNDSEANHLKLMKWGLIPVWSKNQKIGYKLINTRSETVFEKPAWKRPIQRQRCLVPSNGFYEWQRSDDGKKPYLIHPKNSDLFALAGIYDSWTDKTTGEIIESFSILTTKPNQEMSTIHDRMPVILTPDDEARWLNPDLSKPEDIADLFNPSPDNSLDMFEVSTDVNSPATDDEHLIQALPADNASI